ncbi:protein FAM24A [Mastomys coucha]|uniref:protein FAM24A n=1 Tax=Mastomys coucha TaxID=35658 RepID=UPI0012625B9A|nr:protein FAM24A [Mastomys coucha]XP_031244433.1 protein FAM24A [Mastomys coucha]
MFDLRTKVMIGIASTLLIAAVMLITVVLCLYLKISKALKIAKETESCTDPCKDPQEKMIRAKPTIADPCHNAQCFDDCSIYKDIGSLPPCYCVTNEGL